MVFNSLTEAPRNVKECIDWLIALRGTDAEKNLKALGTAVHTFLADKPVGKMQVPALEKIKKISKQFLKKPCLKKLRHVKVILGKFNKSLHKNPDKRFKRPFHFQPIDNENVIQTKGVTAIDIAENLADVVSGCEKFLRFIKNPDQYRSAYSSEATWEASCSKDPEACAVIFVGIAPMLYAGLLSLRKMSNGGVWGEPNTMEGKRARELLKTFGYKKAEGRAGMRYSDITDALEDTTTRMLDTMYDLCGFWAFY
ncbi:hypothetical protein, conserved [Babesia ovata]|uniref:Uncharacterized protein n=1 Tax=Babesia ovata TaxID=189622 RepID=A0A2H6KBE8_9APIC|nr:uncharacterized protein BOVATA_018090 [Babesia ovata]GBE60316.1 hypothetical protein, conserved [Babesia ovata]